ncbi:MAG: isomerizing glutamine--fructose-6-phosphate transaminase, partial [Rhodothermales bacterium]|nr:isomerizing glutamine--fructose-6-phosphate transaminase [Rhodothermales bacterium]
MCGIVGYIGERQAVDVLIKGLKRLEYRGYDSAGVAIVNGHLAVHKKNGKVGELAKALKTTKVDGTLGIGHTRWATHGAPSDTNAHPHMASDGSFALVHNGIIENYNAIRERLSRSGFEFQSETDTEVLTKLIEDVRNTTGLDLPEAVRQALTQVVGTYGIAIVAEGEEDLMIAARKGSPLILGVGDGEYFLGSDAAPLIEYTRQVVYLNDGEMVVVRRNSFDVSTIDKQRINKEIHQLEWDLEEIEKGGYSHFMIKEIFEQPKSLANCMRGRVRVDENMVQLGGLVEHIDRLAQADRIIIAA